MKLLRFAVLEEIFNWDDVAKVTCPESNLWCWAAWELWLSDHISLLDFTLWVFIFDSDMKVVEGLANWNNTESWERSWCVEIIFDPCFFVSVVFITVFRVVFAVQEVGSLVTMSHSRDLNSVFKVNLMDWTEETSSGNFWLIDTLSHSSPLIVGMIFTLMTCNVNEFTTKEAAVFGTSPHVDGLTDLTSWELLLSKLGTESRLHSLVISSAWSSDMWFCWLDGNGFGIFNPSSVLPSPPGTFFELEWESTMMPVASIPRPSDSCESFLWWTPVHPWFAVVRPSVPDT